MNGILVVDEDSSNPGIRDVKPVAISEDYISIAKPDKNDLVYLSTIKFCEEVFTSKIEKNKFQEITSPKINAVLQGNNISGGNVGNTGVFQNNTIENVNFWPQSSGEALTKESTQGLSNIPENFSRRTGAKKFVGRDDVIKILHEQLKVTEQVAITSVTGMGGIGKTELALQYAHFHFKQKTYTGGICWLSCRGQNVGLQIISFAISKFNLSFSKDDDLQTQIDSCWHNWQDGNVLVIFDDVVNYKDISDFLPPGKSRFKVLITTRQKWLTQSFQRLELEVLDKDAALELLISYVGSARIQGELEEAEALCKDLGFLPLGLELVARYLERKSSLSLAKTHERLGLEHKSLKAFSQDMTAERGVAAAFELSWKELDKDDKELGCLLSLFAAAKIPWNLVEQCLSDVDEEELEDRRDEKLLHLSLLQSLGENCYEFHPLIREFFRNKLSGLDFVEEMKQNICRVIVGVARKIPYDITVEQVKEVEIDIPHITEIADNLAEYLSDDDLITPFIGLGRFYEDQGLYPLAQPWLEKGKEIAEKRLDKNNSGIATVCNNLALLYYSQGKYEAAEPLLLQAIEIKKIALPENHPSLAINLNNLAELYRAQGKYEAAEPLLLQAIEIDKIALPENHPQLATHLNNLALLYDSQGKYEAAEPLLLQAIEIKKIALPENHPQLATYLNNLAGLYNSQGKYEAAEPLYLQAIEIDKIALPENHPQLATYLNNLAELYRTQGKYKAAEPLYLQAIEINKIALPENHPSLARDLNNLALLYYSQGKYEAAEQLYLQVIEMHKIALPENHPQRATGLNNLAELYRAQGKYEAVEQLYLQVIEMHKIALPENHPQRASSLNNLALLYDSQGKYEAAEPLLLQAIEIDKIALPENHPSLARDLNNLASLYRAQGKYEAAEPLLLQAIEIDKIALPENHPQLATYLNNLASLYRAQGKYEAAESLYLQAIEINKIALPENHPSLATHLNNLALLYDSQGKYEAAEPLFLQAIEICIQSLGKEHPNTQTALKNYQIFLNKKNESKQNKDKY
ncbi:MAG: tetratricopeptide repeat protein [Trichodesmium sp. MAG_R03]|nr:tetratricopeptide repeat protein [Trichodesmium sp. MAG_R03]